MQVLDALLPEERTRHGLRLPLQLEEVEQEQTERDDGYGPYAKYEKTRIVCDFKVPPYNILGDGDRTHEWQRFCDFTPVSKTENIQLPRGTFQFLNEVTDAQNQARMLESGDDFAVMERGICLGIRSVAECGDETTSDY